MELLLQGIGAGILVLMIIGLTYVGFVLLVMAINKLDIVLHLPRRYWGWVRVTRMVGNVDVGSTGKITYVIPAKRRGWVDFGGGHYELISLDDLEKGEHESTWEPEDLRALYRGIASGLVIMLLIVGTIAIVVTM